MKKNNKHLNINLEFLGRRGGVTNKSDRDSTKNRSSAKTGGTPPGADNYKLDKKWFLWIGLAVIFIIILTFYDSGYDNNTQTRTSLTPRATPTTLDQCSSGTVRGSVSGLCVTRYKACSEKWLHSTWSGEYDSDGSFLCDCTSGYTWNSNQTACVLTTQPPPNSKPANSYWSTSTTWKCQTGYQRVNNTCQALSKPANSYWSTSTTWKCQTGYQRVNNTCQAL